MTVAGHRASDALRTGLHLSGWDAQDLWIAAFALGADLTLPDIDAILDEQLHPTPMQYNLLSLALNESLDDAGLDHTVMTWDQLAELEP